MLSKHSNTFAIDLHLKTQEPFFDQILRTQISVSIPDHEKIKVVYRIQEMQLNPQSQYCQNIVLIILAIKLDLKT